MKKFILFILLFLSTACSHSPLVTKSLFDSVPYNATTEQVKKLLGEPYDIKKSDQGEEYRYIERVNIGKRDSIHRHYVLKISKGVVVEKSMKEVDKPPIDFKLQY